MELEQVKPDPTSWVKVISYHGKQFVSGLYWHPLNSPQKYMREARAYGKAHDLDFVAIRETPTKIQAGFVSKKLGATKGMYSLARALSGQFDGDFVACWEIDSDCYAIVGTAESAIIPGFDLVTTKAEAQAKIRSLQNRGLLKNVQLYVPDGFGYDVRPFDIEELLHPKRLRDEYRLKQLTFGLSKKELTGVLLSLSVVIAAVAGYQGWQFYQDELERKAQARAELIRQQELERRNSQAKAPLDLSSLDHPWASIPDSQDMLRACSKAERVLPLSIAGWMFASAKCDGKALVANYQRTGTSTAIQFATAAEEIFPEGPAFLIDNGDLVGVQISLKVAIGSDEELLEQDPILRAVTSHFYKQGAQPVITIMAVEPVQTLPGGDKPAETIQPPWKRFSFKADPLLPPELALADLPGQGVRITLIETTLKDSLTWTVSGEIYAK